MLLPLYGVVLVSIFSCLCGGGIGLIVVYSCFGCPDASTDLPVPSCPPTVVIPGILIGVAVGLIFGLSLGLLS